MVRRTNVREYKRRSGVKVRHHSRSINPNHALMVDRGINAEKIYTDKKSYSKHDHSEVDLKGYDTKINNFYGKKKKEKPIISAKEMNELGGLFNKSASKKIPVKEVRILWSEGFNDIYIDDKKPLIFDGAKAMDEANGYLKWASQYAPEGGTYDKHKIKVTWVDGFSITERWDVQRDGTDTTIKGVLDHLQKAGGIYSGRKDFSKYNITSGIVRYNKIVKNNEKKIASKSKIQYEVFDTSGFSKRFTFEHGEIHKAIEKGKELSKKYDAEIVVYDLWQDNIVKRFNVKDSKEKKKCQHCGELTPTNKLFSYVDGNNIAITKNSPSLCLSCYNKKYGENKLSNKSLSIDEIYVKNGKKYKVVEVHSGFVWVYDENGKLLKINKEQFTSLYFKEDKSNRLSKEERIEAYKDKREARLERYEELADKRSKESTEAYESSNKLARMRPMGEPIKVGHHSEGRDRRHFKRIHSLMDKTIELQGKSDYYRNKADSIKSNNVISSDDPEAVDKLKVKLQKMEEQRVRIKEQNKALKKEKKDINPSWVLSNLGQNITTVKKRIKNLEYKEKLENKTVGFSGGKIVQNADINRVQILYDEIPSAEKRAELKQWGFRWSPREKAWQRHLNNASFYSVERVTGVKWR